MIRLCASMSNIKRVKSNNLFDIIYLKSRTEFWAAFVISRAYFGAKKTRKFMLQEVLLNTYKI